MKYFKQFEVFGANRVNFWFQLTFGAWFARNAEFLLRVSGTAGDTDEAAPPGDTGQTFVLDEGNLMVALVSEHSTPPLQPRPLGPCSISFFNIPLFLSL